MDESITIQKNTRTKDDLDFGFLREFGLKYLEKIGSKLWTDYNTHDPGITILEMLCYAITDLSQRIEMPIENLLASETENFKNMHEQFISAVNILPSKPLTALDYRKLFVHLKGVKNAWIMKHDRKVYLNCEDHNMSYKPFDINEKDQKEFSLQGLNDIYLDLENDVEDPEAIFSKVREIYHENRNLCEDLVNICEIPEQHISVCTYLEIEPDADEERIQALIIKAINHYLSPSISFYLLQQMYDKGYSTDQIFEGPVPFPGSCIDSDDLQGGFIDSKELSAATLRKEVRLSDIIQIIMKIKGVKLIKDISLQTCKDNDNQDPWILCVKNNHKPVLCWDSDDDECKGCNTSVFNFSKGLLPIGINKNRVIDILEELESEEQQLLSEIITEDVSFPLGDFSNASSYSTIQNDFPDTYGISPIGLSNNATKARKAKAKQLKAYLLFFDQTLGNYFSHLSKVKDLLSIDESLKKLYTVNAISELTSKEKQTYFTQTVGGLTGIDILVNPVSYEDNLIEIVNKLKNDSNEGEDDTFYERRSQFLDHLIARFAERFSDYAFIMQTLYGAANSRFQILKAKTKFVQDYREISCERGLGFNYCGPEIWDTPNVSGAQKRIARLTGISDYTRRNLLTDATEVVEHVSTPADDPPEYGWRIKDGDRTLISSNKRYHNAIEAFEGLFLAIELATDVDNYKLAKTKTGKTSFNIINPKIPDKEEGKNIIAKRVAFASKKKTSEEKRNEIITYLNDLSAYQEGIYLIEHILLRPDTYNAAKADKKRKSLKDTNPDVAPEYFMPSCLNGDCETCGPLDPYSFRVSVILPGWTRRFANKDFRLYIENIIREELPAHVLARICWIGHAKGAVPDTENDMLLIQEKYHSYLEELQQKCTDDLLSKEKIEIYRKTLKEFIPCLNGVHSIYESGKLHDCNNEDTETEENKIILGRTNIGNL